MILTFLRLFLLSTLLYFSPLYGNEETLATLQKLYESKVILDNEIKAKNITLKASRTEEEKEALKDEIKLLNDQASDIETKFEKIATGIDTSEMKPENKSKETTLTEDFQLLLRPLVESAKSATKEMRKKSELQEEAEHYKTMLEKATKASDSITTLIKLSKDKELIKELKPLQKYWSGQVVLLSNNLNASLHQITMLEQNSISFTDSLQDNTKKFFQERGLYLLEGFIAFISVIIVMNLIHILLVKLFPIFTKPSRSFFLRLLDLLYRLLTILLAIVIPMGIFYIKEDWFLFSIGILLLFGLAWTFRHFIARFWEQTRLFLNIGSVREDERILYKGLPWRVKNINIFTVIENPTLNLKLRVPIETLIGLTSRPTYRYEPWFPCKQNEWVLLSDNYFGRVVGVSLEFIEFEDLGGGHKTYLVTDFLSLAPLNLSYDFRIVENFGISYRHQKESTTTVVEQLEAFITQKIQEEGYKPNVKHLLVQFHSAGDSSLNLVIIVNFYGDMAPFYYRLRRSIQRWCVDACNTYGWEIPFPQLTIHQGNPS